VIRRRYIAGVKNLFQVYRPVLDSWRLFDNSRLVLYTIAREENGSLTVLDEALLARFMKIPENLSGQKLENSCHPELGESDHCHARCRVQKSLKNIAKPVIP